MAWRAVVRGWRPPPPILRPLLPPPRGWLLTKPTTYRSFESNSPDVARLCLITIDLLIAMKAKPIADRPVFLNWLGFTVKLFKLMWEERYWLMASNLNRISASIWFIPQISMHTSEILIINNKKNFECSVFSCVCVYVCVCVCVCMKTTSELKTMYTHPEN